MPPFLRSELPDLAAFSVVVRRRSFKAAAIELGLTTSALSHAIRRLEERLGAKLLNRTSRSVPPTAAGLRFAARLEVGFEEIGSALSEIDDISSGAFGELRLNIPADASRLLVSPVLATFQERFPDMRLTVVVENRPVDMVAEGFDAGIRYGDTVPEDMVAIALTAPLEWVVVGAPKYLDTRGRPREPRDLTTHSCLRLLLGDNSHFRWELGNGDAMVRIDVPGTCTISDTQTTIDAAVDGLGLANVLRRRVEPELRDGRLEVIMPDWSSTGAGFHMYYPSRRQNHPALRLMTDLIRSREGLVRERQLDLLCRRQ
ncbi:LysR family transcriptional regulator [Xaviernesmea oryzae]|uniref:HTH-type transcriptional regulator TtuA n=1 Tax=Xaviernesmea oryzae TaxID=464029 RepID=A0A1Q9B3W5_9HYPH|nr:LysR substrate-binding domain-containing protein [Xaviernesmea oryzae]OLP62761.1 LysR family transcriptional regulator [Xaviernesmea oryzae]SEM38662.1 transcriptional regulator, LysR family [Xaviernesmea oryzae]